MSKNARHDLETRLAFAIEAAEVSAQLTLKYFGNRSRLGEQSKADGSPVTIADRACESDLRERLHDRYPDDSILGEEFDPKEGTTEYQWVIDPIDGTVSFVQGVPLYGTMLACLRNGEPEIGVIVMPALDETVYAATGLGCRHRSGRNSPAPCRVSAAATLETALVCTTSMGYFTTPPHRRLYEQLDAQARHTRGWSDCYAWVLLATGRADAVIEPVLNLWDFAAALPIITEAGGDWSDLAGDRNLKSGEVVAANPALLGQLQGLIRLHATQTAPETNQPGSAAQNRSKG